MFNCCIDIWKILWSLSPDRYRMASCSFAKPRKFSVEKSKGAWEELKKKKENSRVIFLSKSGWISLLVSKMVVTDDAIITMLWIVLQKMIDISYQISIHLAQGDPHMYRMYMNHLDLALILLTNIGFEIESSAYQINVYPDDVPQTTVTIQIV